MMSLIYKNIEFFEYLIFNFNINLNHKDANKENILFYLG